MFRRNLGLKALAAIIAMLLYFFVHSQSNSSVRTLVVPVEVQNLPENRVLVIPTARQAQVTIQGPSFLVAEIASSALAFKVRLPPNVGKRHEVSLQEESLGLPSAIRVLSIDPSEMEVLLDTRAAKTVPVEVPKIGTLSDTLKLSDLAVSPDRVEVSGPESELGALSSLQTYPIDLRSISGDTTLNLAIRTPSVHVRLSQGEVSVSVKVSSVTVERNFSGVPVEIRSRGPGNYVLSPRSVFVQVSGPKAVVKELKKEEIIPYVRIDAPVEEQKEFEVSVDLPKGVGLVFLDPKKIQAAPVSSPVEIETAAPKKPGGGKVK